MHSSGEKWSFESTVRISSDGLLKEVADVEAQTRTFEKAPPVENPVSTRLKLLYLAAWFLFNLILTVLSKAILQQAPFPWLLTTLHASATSLGCFALLASGRLKLTTLGKREQLTLVAFSFLFTINIALNNVSLAMVSVPFHQIMRSTCPIVTILLYRAFYARTYSTATYLSIIPLVLGVALATFGDYSFTILGFACTQLGVVLASVKAVATNRLMTGRLALSALEVLFRMSPLAAIQCLVYAVFAGELNAAFAALEAGKITVSLLLALATNAIIAFMLNVVSFQTNKVAGALTLAVAGNVKQCLAILLGIVLFNVEVGPLNAMGMVINVLGAAWYTRVELNMKRSNGQG